MSGAVVTPQPEVVEEGHRSSPVKCELLRTNSPLAQVCLIGLVCFCCPGMFNALSGIGGGGQVDHTVADNANTALYACFAVFGILGGAAHNLLGPRTTLLLGALACPLYDASFLYYNLDYNHRRSMAFPVAAGAILGAGAGLLWAAQGAIITAYPPPNRRGTYISIFWCLYNFGGVFGGLFPFRSTTTVAANQPVVELVRWTVVSPTHQGSNPTMPVNDGTYVAFMAFVLLGSALALLILPPSKITRDDGSKVAGVAYSSVANASCAPRGLRTQGLNNVFYWGARMIGSAGIGYFLDFGFASRRKRGFIGVIIVARLSTAIWGGGLANQLRYKDGKWEDLIDFKDGRRYAGPFLLLVYWIIAALSDDPRVLSRYIGFYNGAQSAGATVAWQVDRHKTSLISQLFINWGLMTLSCPLLALLVFLAVKDEANTMVVKDKDSLVP
ncbi:hypothetical protein CFC21_085036 [Triticum aestivum]|uniref:Uncharacterized protein n=2 Tax=Triticum aestivum TaxID=4565 RepID=A0A3B6NWE5_WHEAT|nr:hypothetical protein CFC21_085036 [Triticum aestivum]